jgi:hypothetical protein
VNNTPENNTDCERLNRWFDGRLDWMSGGVVLFQELGPFFGVQGASDEVLIFADGNNDANTFQSVYVDLQTSIITAPDLMIRLFATDHQGRLLQVTEQRYMPVASALWAKHSEDAAQLQEEVNSILHSSLTINAGPGLSGGGTIPVGGATTLANAGVLSFDNRSGAVNLTSSDVTGVLNAGTGISIAAGGTISFDTTLGDSRYATVGGAQTITGAKNFTNVASAFTGTFTGNGAGLTHLNLSGDGSGLTNLNAGNLSTGTVSSARLGGTYNISITGNASTATTATNLTGTLPITNGGTGATSFTPGKFTFFDGTKLASTVFDASSFAPTSDSNNYIQNNSGSAQSANFSINGNGTLGGTIQAANAAFGTVNATLGVAQGDPTGLSGDLGVYSNGAGKFERFVTRGGNFEWFSDGNYGTIPIMQLTPTGNLTAASVDGNGAGLTNLNASNIAVGTVPTTALAGTYNISITGNAASASSLIGTLPITSGGTGSTIFTLGKFISFDGSRLSSTPFDPSSFAPVSGSNSYIQNNSGSAQSASFNINGDGILSGTIQAASGAFGTVIANFGLVHGNPMGLGGDLGVYSNSVGKFERFVTRSGNFMWFSDGDYGTIPIMQLTPTGNLTAASVSGNGVGLSNLNASNIAEGTVPTTALSGTYNISITGNAATATSLLGQSDRRWKKNIAPLGGALDEVERMRGVQFEWRRDEYPDERFPEGRQIGFVAQEVEEVLPELVRTDEKGYKSLAYANVTAVLVEAVKEQQRLIEQQRSELSTVQAQLAELRAAVAAFPGGEHLRPAAGDAHP